MKFSLYTHNGSYQYGSIRIGMTGNEMLQLYGSMTHPAGERLTFRIEYKSGKAVGRIDLGREGDYAVQKAPEMMRAAEESTPLGDVVTSHAVFSNRTAFGIKTPLRSKTVNVIPVITGTSIVFDIPMEFFMLAPAQLKHQPEAKGHKFTEKKVSVTKHVVSNKQSNTSDNTQSELKAALEMLNDSIAKAHKSGQKLKVEVGTDGMVKIYRQQVWEEL